MVHPVSRRSVLSISLALLLVGVLLTLPGSPARAANPSCLDVALALDESGSVGTHEAQVRAAAGSFLNGLANQGPTAAIVEFGTRAETVVGHTAITDDSIAAVFEPYLATGYDSPSQTGPFTNWDDALANIAALNSEKVAPLVLFVTDGDPTAFNLDGAGESGGVASGSSLTAEALARAVVEADAVKAQGSHILAIGVGGAASSDSRARLEAVAGPDVFDGTGTLDPFAHDIVLVPDFDELPAVLANVAVAMCADPSIDITKTADASVIEPGSTVTYTLVVTNTGNVDLSDVAVTDPTFPGCDRFLGNLAVGEQVSYTCSTQLLVTTTNVATVDGTDPLGTSVQDDDDAVVIVVVDPQGTGTPGYWKNHTDAWILIEGGILIGDWNRNTVCDAGESCLALTMDEAMAALSTPPRGDATYNVARPLVAAWLNVLGFNESSCIVDEVDAAVDWLTAYPIGSSPARDAWAGISDAAGRLDDYNNGRLCAPSRDARDNDGAEGTKPEGTTPGEPGGPATPPTADPPNEPVEEHPSDRGRERAEEKGKPRK